MSALRADETSAEDLTPHDSSGRAGARLGDGDGDDPTQPVALHVWLFLAFVVSNVFSGDFALLGLPVPIDRPLLLISVVLMVLDYRTAGLKLRWNHAIMGVLVLWVLWSWMSTGTILDSYKAFALADRVAVPMLMFLVGPLMFPDRRSRMLLLKTLTPIGIYLGFTGVFEIAHLDKLIWPSFIADPTLGIQDGRARGPFLASEPMGMATSLITITSGVLARYSRGAWRIAAVLACVVCPVTALLCLTRSIWLGGGLSILLCFAVVPALRRVAPLAAIATALVVAGAWSIFPSVANLVTSRADTSRTVYDRLLTDHAAVRIMEAKPIFGVGWQRFIDVVGVWVRQADTYPLTNTAISVHNVFLSLAAETGIPGAVLWGLAMLTGPVAVVLSRHRRTGEMQAWRLIAACGVLVWIGPTLLSPNPYPFPNNLIWLFGGVAGSAILTSRGNRTSIDRDPGHVSGR